MKIIRKYLLVVCIVFLVITTTACTTQTSTELRQADSMVNNYSSVIVERQYIFTKTGQPTQTSTMKYNLYRKGNLKAHYTLNDNHTFFYNDNDKNYRLIQKDGFRFYEALSTDVAALWNFRNLVPKLKHINPDIFTIDGNMHIYKITINGKNFEATYPMLSNMLRLAINQYETNPNYDVDDVNVEIQLILNSNDNNFVEMNVIANDYLKTVYKNYDRNLINPHFKFLFTYGEQSAPEIKLKDYHKDDAPFGYDGVIPMLQIGEWFTVNTDYMYDTDYVKFKITSGIESFIKLEFQGMNYDWNIYKIEDFHHIKELNANFIYLEKGEYIISIRGINVGQVTFRLALLN